MAKYTLNIYGNNDEIIKCYETDRIRWGVYLEAVNMSENGLNGKSPIEQFEIMGTMLKKVFIGLTDEELECADAEDVMNTFTMLVRSGNAIKTGESKNADGVK